MPETCTIKRLLGLEGSGGCASESGTGLKETYITGIVLIGVLLLLVLVLLIAVCCLASRLRRKNRSCKESKTDSSTKGSTEALNEEKATPTELEMESVKVKGPDSNHSKEAKSANVPISIQIDCDAMYDTVQDVQIIAKTPQEGNPLPDYDTIGHEENIRIPSSPKKATTASPSNHAAVPPAEYSVIMKKTQPKVTATGDGNYNVLIHNTTPASTEGAAFIGKDPGNDPATFVPPPLPPPISESDLKAVNESENNAKESTTEVPAAGKSAPDAPAVNQSVGDKTAAVGSEELSESLYMNV